MTPTSFYIKKFKVLSEDDGMTATQFGNHKLSNSSIEIDFIEIGLEDLTPEQASLIKVGAKIFLNFNGEEISVPTHTRSNPDSDDAQIPLYSKEPVEAEILEIIDKTDLSNGCVLLKVASSHEFIFGH